MTGRTEVELIAWHRSGFRLPFIVQANQSVLVGKSRNCGVQLRGHDICDIHCSIGFGDGQLWVQDWMSASGTIVNGVPVTSRTFVGMGCVIEIGSYKIQLSPANEATLKSPSDDGAKHHTTPTPVDENNSMEHSSNMSTQPSAVVAVQAALHSEVSPANPLASKHLSAPEQSVLDVPTCNEAGVAPLRQPMADIDRRSQEDETYDRETVELLLAEIEDLRTALAQADARHDTVANSMAADAMAAGAMTAGAMTAGAMTAGADDSDRVLTRIQELSEEANRAEERVLLLEEMLHAAEDANRSEVEERSHLEAWVGDIEKRVGQREAEHAAELEALRERLDSADKANVRLQRQLQQRAADGEGTDSHNGDVLEQLQRENSQLQNSLAAVTKDLRQLKQKLESQSQESDTALREERAKIAREHAEMSRLKYEYAQKIKELEELPTSTAQVDPSRQSLIEHRQYLRGLNKGKIKCPTAPSLASRLKSIWKMID